MTLVPVRDAQRKLNMHNMPRAPSTADLHDNLSHSQT